MNLIESAKQRLELLKGLKGRKVVIPRVPIPWMIYKNPYDAEISKTSFEWFLDNLGMDVDEKKRENFLAHENPRLASLAFPFGDKEKTRICADFFACLHAWDDVIEYDKSFNFHFDTEKDIEYLDNAYLKMTADIKRRLNLNDVLERRFKMDFENMMESIRLMRARGSSEDPFYNVDDYLKIRRLNSSVRFNFVVVEWTMGITLPDELYAHPIVDELIRLGEDLLVLGNDLLCVMCDYQSGEAINMALVYYLNGHAETIQKAVDMLHGAIGRSFLRYCEVVEEGRKSPIWCDDLEKFDLGVRCYVSGYFEWAHHAPRFFGLDTLGKRLDYPIEITL
jgi:hypothetical protein